MATTREDFAVWFQEQETARQERNPVNFLEKPKTPDTSEARAKFVQWFEAKEEAHDAAWSPFRNA